MGCPNLRDFPANKVHQRGVGGWGYIREGGRGMGVKEGGEGEYAEPGKGKVISDLAKVWVKVGGTLEQVFQLFFTFAPPHFTYRIFLFD